MTPPLPETPAHLTPAPAPAVAGGGAAAALEEVPCPLCSASEPAAAISFAPYRVVRCSHCRVWYLSPRLTEERMLSAYGDEAYFEGADGPGYSSYLAQETTLRATFRRFLAAMERRGMTGGRLLEVGCAYGFFLDEAEGFFDSRTGTDYSAAAAGRARANAERIVLGGLADLAPGETFDCAVLIHVIEHIYQPRAFLADLYRRLAPGGWIVLAAPDMGSFWRPLLGRRWPFFKVPEHVTYFSRPSLARLLTGAGCERVVPLPYTSYFSAELIAEKLGPRWASRLPPALARRRFWMPATTVALAGRKPADR